MSSRSGLAEDLLTQLRSLIGKPCWAFYAGESTGPDVIFDFGRKIPRTVPLLNRHLTEEQRYYEGEVSLYITCAWRLDSESEVICGSTDSAAEDGPMVRGLRALVGRTVESTEIVTPGFDLTLRFNGNLALKIFSDQTNLEDEYDNYSVHLKKHKIYIVGVRGRIRCELPSEVRSA